MSGDGDAHREVVMEIVISYCVYVKPIIFLIVTVIGITLMIIRHFVTGFEEIQ